MRMLLLVLALLLIPVGAEPVRRSPGSDFGWAGRRVAVWEPRSRCAPLVLFSHGFHGNRNQSTRLCKALAEAGYLVVAVNHKDANLGAFSEASIVRPDLWTESTYKDRRDDLVAVLHFLRTDPVWAARVDWSLGVALMGHSLGGYTAFGTAGAWPSWTQKEARISAVLGLSPYIPVLRNRGQIRQLGIPCMFQTGNLDIGVKPTLVRGGIFDEVSSPAYYVELRRAGHFAWTDLNDQYQAVIAHYCVAFLDRYLKGRETDLDSRWPQVLRLRSK